MIPLISLSPHLISRPEQVSFLHLLVSPLLVYILLWRQHLMDNEQVSLYVFGRQCHENMLKRDYDNSPTITTSLFLPVLIAFT